MEQGKGGERRYRVQAAVGLAVLLVGLVAAIASVGERRDAFELLQMLHADARAEPTSSATDRGSGLKAELKTALSKSAPTAQMGDDSASAAPKAAPATPNKKAADIHMLQVRRVASNRMIFCLVHCANISNLSPPPPAHTHISPDF